MFSKARVIVTSAILTAGMSWAAFAQATGGKLTAEDASISAATNTLTAFLTDNVPSIVGLVLLIAAAMLAIRFVYKRVKRVA